MKRQFIIGFLVSIAYSNVSFSQEPTNPKIYKESSTIAVRTFSDTTKTLKISVHSGAAAELRTRKNLIDLTSKYQLEPYIITWDIIIHEGALSFSHPVLTLNTANDNEDMLLADFLHEQMHWYAMMPENIDSSRAVFDKLVERFPEPIIEFPKGGGDIQGTYIHLLVNYLEFNVLTNVLGEAKALEIFQTRRTKFYTWIYESILNNLDWYQKTMKEANLYLN